MNDYYLFTYGTLAPGRKNHHRLQHLPGHWEAGRVRGRLIEAGWAAADGFPAMRPDPEGDFIHGFLFYSDALPAMWTELDKFEGADYERTPIEVQRDNGEIVQAYIYALSPAR